MSLYITLKSLVDKVLFAPQRRARKGVKIGPAGLDSISSNFKVIELVITLDVKVICVEEKYEMFIM